MRPKCRTGVSRCFCPLLLANGLLYSFVSPRVCRISGLGPSTRPLRRTSSKVNWNPCSRLYIIMSCGFTKWRRWRMKVCIHLVNRKQRNEPYFPWVGRTWQQFTQHTMGLRNLVKLFIRPEYHYGSNSWSPLLSLSWVLLSLHITYFFTLWNLFVALCIRYTQRVSIRAGPTGTRIRLQRH